MLTATRLPLRPVTVRLFLVLRPEHPLSRLLSEPLSNPRPNIVPSWVTVSTPHLGYYVYLTVFRCTPRFHNPTRVPRTLTYPSRVMEGDRGRYTRVEVTSHPVFVPTSTPVSTPALN